MEQKQLLHYSRIIFLQGEVANEALTILENEGEIVTINHLSQWDYNEAEIEHQYKYPHGSSDTVYENESYVLSYNLPLQYIGLIKKEEWGADE